MRNPQKNLNIIWKPLHSALPPYVQQKSLHPAPFPLILEKSNPPSPHFYDGGGEGIRTMLNQNLAHKKLILKAVRNIFHLKVVSCRNQSIYLLGLPWIGFCFLLKGICQYYLLLLNFYKFVMHCSWTNHWPKPCKSTREMSKDKQEITFDYDFSQFHSS